MSGSSWNLVIPVLLIGLVVGAAWAWWWARNRTRRTPAQERDRELMLKDLEARQAQLYAQLREASDAEREALEVAAARNLMAIEQAGGKPRGADAGGAAEQGLEPTAAPMPAVAPTARPLSPWLGFLGGVACAALVGVLVMWAQRDAQPRPGEAPAPMMSEDARHPAGPALDERDREVLEQLAQQIASDPTDLMARKQYAVGLLSTGQFVEAFEQADILLGSDPSDPDGLYVKGMVRMRMGQEDGARALLDQLVLDYPEHVPALTALGVLALRKGGLAAAEEYWQQALEVSGGSNQEIERLRAAAREQFSGDGQGAATAPTRATTTAPVSGPVYTLEIDLAPGAKAPPTAQLFVSLRAGAGGPPTAVTRVVGPRFPLTVTLGAGETMMGQPLPEAGTIFARLDADGNASTREDDELRAEIQMRVGETARLTLK